MKKLILPAILGVISFTSYGQSGQKFSSGLNSLSGTDALGSSNNFPLVIKTNGTEKMRITETGRVGIGIIPSGRFKLDVAGGSHCFNAYVDSLLQAMIVSAKTANFTTAFVNETLTVNGIASFGSQNTLSLDGDNHLITSSSGAIDFGANNLSTNGNVFVGGGIRSSYISSAGATFAGIAGYTNFVSSAGFTDLSLVNKGYVDSTITDKLHHAVDWNHVVLGNVANYSSDYSAAFTNRSLVDKQYVDNKVGAIPPAPQVFIPGTGQYSAINNQTGNSAQADYSFVGGGTNNSILPIAQYGIIMGGTGNQIENYVTPPPPGILSQYDLIGTGNNNVIKFSAGNSVILSGQNNTIADEYSVILSGNNNSIEAPAVYSKSYNLITGGNDNTIRSSAHHTAIIGGSGNAIANGVANAVILGGTNITATESNAVYVPKIAFPDGSMQEKAGVAAGDSASFSSLRIPNLSGTGDRIVMVDSSGNLKIQPPPPLPPCIGLDPFWKTDGNNLPASCQPFIGSTNAADVIFKTDANGAGGERMRITATGNVGIGTTTPGRNLHIKALSAYCPTCPPSETAYIRMEDEVHDQTLTGPVLTTNLWDIGADAFFFIQNANTNMKSLLINSAGNVGIGTGALNSKLEIHGGGSSNSTSSLNILNNNSTSLFFVRDDGNVGIGTAAPNFKLDVNGNVGINTATPTPNAKLDVNGNAYFSGPVAINTAGTATNTFPTGYMLGVGGKVIAEEFLVKLRTAGWPDYVFNKGYNLKGLDELENFVNTNKHLPGIPTAKEVESNGLALSDMVTKQMEKIEELSLYLIEMNKKIEKLSKENEELKSIIKK